VTIEDSHQLTRRDGPQVYTAVLRSRLDEPEQHQQQPIKIRPSPVRQAPGKREKSQELLTCRPAAQRTSGLSGQVIRVLSLPLVLVTGWWSGHGHGAPFGPAGTGRHSDRSASASQVAAPIRGLVKD